MHTHQDETPAEEKERKNYSKLIFKAARLITFATLLITAKQQLKSAIKISLKILRSFKLRNLACGKDFPTIETIIERDKSESNEESFKKNNQ